MQEVVTLSSALDIAGVASVPIVVEKSLQMMRRIEQTHLNINKSFMQNRPILALEISCRIANVPFNKTTLLKTMKIPEREYNQALITLKRVLNLSWASIPVIEVLATKFGVTFKNRAFHIIEQYKTHYLSGLDKSVQANIDLSSPEYHAAAFFLAAKMDKKNLDRRHILRLAEVDAEVFKRVLMSMEKNIPGYDSKMASDTVQLKSGKSGLQVRGSVQKNEPNQVNVDSSGGGGRRAGNSALAPNGKENDFLLHTLSTREIPSSSRLPTTSTLQNPKLKQLRNIPSANNSTVTRSETLERAAKVDDINERKRQERERYKQLRAAYLQEARGKQARRREEQQQQEAKEQQGEPESRGPKRSRL